MKKIVVLLGIAIMIILIAFISNSSRPNGDERLVCHVGGTMKPVVSRLAELYEQETGQQIEIRHAGEVIATHPRGRGRRGTAGSSRCPRS